MTNEAPPTREQHLIPEAGEASITVNTTSIRLIAGGDVMLGRQMPGRVALHGPNWPFAGIAGLLKTADLALVNLETCISTLGDFLDKGGRQPYYYHALPEMLDVLTAANIQCVTTANNHAMDYGKEALLQQRELLDASGFLHFGSGRDIMQAAQPGYARINGLTIAFIGVETETPNMQAGLDTPGIFYASIRNLLNTAAETIATARAHADIVIVTPHWGGNWQEAPSSEMREVARGLIDLGADAVLGHSAHILHGVELHAGRPIVYDMGTLLFDRVAQSRMADSALFELELDAQGVRQLTIHPVQLTAGQARPATGENAARIRELLIRLSLDLNPSTPLEPMADGLRLRLQCSPPPRATRAQQKNILHKILPQAAHPKLPAWYRQLKSNLVCTELPPGAQWATRVAVNPELEILGARFASPVQPGRGFVCEVNFRASAPPMPSRVEARLTGLAPSGEVAFVYTHPVAEGIHPPAHWSRNEIICDRVLVRPGKVLAEGRYDLYWQLIDQEKKLSLKVDPADKRIVDGMVLLGTLIVSEAAPNGVAGIATAPRLPRDDTLRPKQPWEDASGHFWNEQAKPWIIRALAERGLTLKSDQETVVRNTPWGYIASVPTEQGLFYFKAEGVTSRHEPRLLVSLSRLFPDRIPKPLAIRGTMPWMLTPDYGHSTRKNHENEVGLRELKSMLSKFAEIQIESCRHIQHWLDLGIPDRRLTTLPAQLARLLHSDKAISLGQPTGLDREEQNMALELLPHFEGCCRSLAKYARPTALGHGDLHMDNILFREPGDIFLDWGGASLTFPFCSLLLAYHPDWLQNEARLAERDRIAETYLQHWSAAAGLPVLTLLPMLHTALWVAHAERALNWAHFPERLETISSVGRETLVVKWLRLWMKRVSLLTAPSPQHRLQDHSRPPALATPDNPLLLDLKTIARVTKGEWQNVPRDTFLTGASFKRQYLIEGTQGNLYFSTNADIHDHSFTSGNALNITKALGNGAVAAVVPRSAEGLPAGLPLLRVDHVTHALKVLGSHVRDHLYTGKRVIVTGTEGKTGFKCALHHILASQVSTHAVLNSSNLDHSIHASFASIRQRDRIAIFEAAGTHPGRCKRRSLFVKPHLFVITEVGNEHMMYHGSQQAIIEGKADIALGITGDGCGILNADSKNFEAVRKAVLDRHKVPLLLFGSTPDCAGRLLDRRFENNGWNVTAEIQGIRVSYRVSLIFDHAPLASVSVLLAASHLGADVTRAAEAFHDYHPYESQGAVRQIEVRGGTVELVDNASRASVLSYQSFLKTSQRLSPPGAGGRKVAMIGQMIFLGDESASEHARLAEWVDAAGFDRIFFVGQHTGATYAALKNKSAVVRRFPSYDRRDASPQQTQELIDALLDEIRPGDLLFVKGEVDEVGDYLRTLEIEAGPTVQMPVRPRTTSPIPAAKPAIQTDAGALSGLTPISRYDLPRYKAAINQTKQTVWQSYFPFLYFMGQNSNTAFLTEEDTGSICIYRLRRQGERSDLCLFLLPMPFQPAVLERCLQRVRQYNGRAKASIFRIDAEDAGLFKDRPHTRIVSCPEEYVYAPAHYKDLSGGKNGNLRRNVNKFERRDDIEVADYRIDDQHECLAVIEQWETMQQDKYGELLYQGYTVNCLKQYEQFPRKDLFGKVIRIGGEIRSFGFAGEIRNGLGNLFITKSDHRINGLNKYLNYCLLRAMEHLELVNSSNAGDTPGLAFSKQELGPVALHPLYQVYAGR